MKNRIIKKILLQKKYGNYKYLFSIKLYEIEKIGINNFFIILKKLEKLSEEREKLKYFRLESKYKQYFENNKGKIFIEYDNDKINIDLINTLNSNINNLQFIYKLDSKNNNFNILNNIKIMFFIESQYTKSDVFWFKKNLDLFNDKEIFLSLNSINKQEELDNINLFEIINLLKNNNSFINLDYIRLESAYKNLYAIGPKELHLDLYEFCNTKCNFCFTNGPGFLTNRNDNENKYKMTFPGEKYLNLFKKIEKTGTESLALGITGEPFLHPEINKILKELIYINLSIGFLTNGYKLLENIDLLLKNKNIKHFYINISSGNLESFNITRPGDNFDNFLNTWKAIKLIRKKRPDIIIRGLYVITPQNICGINDFIKLAIKNNLSEIELKRVVPYEFSNIDFNFNKKIVNEIISIIEKNKIFFQLNKIKLIENFDYIIKDFKNSLKIIQYPEDNNEKNKISTPIINNCYNPYFYISLFRNNAFSCGKFIGNIGKLPNFDLHNLLFEKNETKNIILGAKNLKKFLGEKKWKQKCIRCHHLDVNNLVKKYISIKKISLKI